MSAIATPQRIAELKEQVASAWDLRQQDLHAAQDRSHALLREGLALGCHESVILSYRTLGVTARARRDYENALEYLQTALEYAELHSVGEHSGVIYSELGRVYHETGDLERSLSHLYEAHSCHLRHNDNEGLASSYTNLSNLLAKLGRFSEAEANYTQAIELNRSMGNRRGEAAAIGSLALLYFRQGDFGQALKLLMPLEEFFAEFDHKFDLCTYYINVGETYRALGDLPRSIDALQRGAAIAERNDFLRLLITARLELGTTYIAAGMLADAEVELLYVLSAEQSPMLAEIFVAALEAMSELCEKAGRLTDALDYAKRHFAAFSDMERARAQAAAAAVELRLRLEQKEREKGLLQSSNDNLIRLNTELQTANEKLSDLNTQQSDMLRIVSHDIRNPLSAIVGMGNMLATEPEECMLDLAAMGALIEESGRRLLGLVNNLLDVARLKSGEITLKCTTADVECIVTESVLIFQSLAKQKQIELTVNVKSLPFLWVDGPKLEQILSNLISNGIKFTQSGGKVSVSASHKNGATLEIEICDTGIGIPKDPARIQSGLTAALQRRGTNGERGTGLGLSIVNRFVELHGGSLQIDSGEGVGTTIRIQIPAKKRKLDLSPEIEPASE